MQSVTVVYPFFQYASSQYANMKCKVGVLSAVLLSCFFYGIQPGGAIGLIGAHIPMRGPMHGHVVPVHSRHSYTRNAEPKYSRVFLPKGKSALSKSTKVNKPAKNSRHARKGKTAKSVKPVAYLPQNYVEQLKLRTLHLNDAVVYQSVKGPLSINVLNINLLNPRVKVRPILAGDSFSQLREVSDDARLSHALAAVNANYFKRNGTPLGTLIIDGEWVAGPLYDRVSLGIAKDGTAQIDRVKFGGVLTTSNPNAPTIWVNNINQPRRSGCHLIAYTRRWGSFVRLDYKGSLVALDARGRVVDKHDQAMTIPWGGMVLTDSKNAEISKLQVGDETNLRWQAQPNTWHEVSQAVSGGPLLIRDGQLFVDLKDERFCKSWTGSQIHARTAAGVTADHHLLLVTIEGPHTLWDLAKFLQKMGAVDALNLDGGGSTTMVVNGVTVTRAANLAERRVASAFGVFVDPLADSATDRIKEAPKPIEESPGLHPCILRTSVDLGVASPEDTPPPAEPLETVQDHLLPAR